MKRLLVLLGVVVLLGFMGLTTQAIAGNAPTKQPQPVLPQPSSFNQEKQPSPKIGSPFIANDSDSLELPTSLLKTDNQVPFPEVQQIALRNARSLWGNVVQGPVIPYCDGQGRVSAYAFTFRIGDGPFPRYGSAIRENELATKDGKSIYTTMLISARFDATPIPAYGYGLPPFYSRGLEALSVAKKQLSLDNLHLLRIYCLGTPLDLWFEFQGNSESDRITVDPFRHLTKTSLDFQSYVKTLLRHHDSPNSTRVLRFKGQWEKYIKGKTLSSIPNDHYIQYYGNVPFYDWSYGCAPTSAAMLMAFYDNTYINFGLLVCRYFERHPVHDPLEYHVPDAQRWLASYMQTDTTSGGGNTYLSNIGPGIEQYSQYCSNNFTTSSVGNDTFNNFHWPDITSEIDAGNPIVWSVLYQPPNGGHSLCAVGYTDDYFVIVHDTWGNTLQYWFYQWDWIHVVKVYYGGLLTQDVKLTSPHGGMGYGGVNGSGAETWAGGTTQSITWSNRGSSNGTVDIDYSTDGGLGWYRIASAHPNSGQCSWTIPTGLSTTHARVLIELTVNSQFTASDGSWGNFNIIPSGVEENQPTALPTSFRVGTWSPNPFGSSSVLAFDLPSQFLVSAKLYDVTGREVRVLANGILGQGHHTLKWDGRDHSSKTLPAGVYFSRTDIGDRTFTHKIILTR